MKKFLLPFLFVIVVGGIYLFIVFKKRQEPGVAQKQAQQQLTADDVAIVRMEFPQHFEDVADLKGKSVWMKSGYSMPYFPFTGGRVEWTKQVGLLAPDQKLDVKKVIKAVAPASVRDNVQHGDHQALVVFSLPADAAAGSAPSSDKLYAMAVGYLEGPQEEHYYDDLLFYYDDPHTIYANWGKDMWAAIDAHQVKPGMSELQARTAIGNMQTADGEKEGNRTVDYDVDGKHTLVTFSHDKATSIQSK